MNQLIQQIKEKESELNGLKGQYNKKVEEEKTKILKSKTSGLSKSLYLLSYEFESSSGRTPQYLEFHRVFKRELTAILKPHTKKIEISKPNHFDVDGFFQLNDGRIFWFCIGDLRWDKDNMLIRTAKNFKDYTGGSNGFVNLDRDFIKNLFQYIGIKE